MRNRVVLVDLSIAILIVVIVMIVSPGIAVTGLLALAVLMVLGLSFAWGLRHR